MRALLGHGRRLAARYGRAALLVSLRVLARPWVWASLVFLLASGVGVAWGSWRNLCATCPSIAQIRTWEPEQTTKVLTHDGQLLVELGIELRTAVSIDAVPTYVSEAVVAIEDKRFYEHKGFDPVSIARAMVGVVTGRSLQLGGGSTISQQLARRMFPQGVGTERRFLGFVPTWSTITRKLREVQVALQLEQAYSKDRILEAYLNQIYMGRGPIHGFQNASLAYFGKNLLQVDVAEAALLAAILNRPGTYDPFREPENALRRRNLVLDRMAEQGYLTEEETASWKAAPLPTEDHSSGTAGEAPYFEEWVRQILDDRFGDELYRGGFRVYTTLDRDMQRAARRAMEWGWARIEADSAFPHPPKAEFDSASALPAQTPYVQGALVALDPLTGQVRAYVGGRDFQQSKFDRVRGTRHAGSGFKPFVYASAIASGIPASQVVMDTAFTYLQNPEDSTTLWEPQNFDGEFRGPMTIRDALRQSINLVAIRLGWEHVGIETVIQTARRMGITTHINPFPSTTIGAVGVQPLELAQAYAAFATLGTRVTPRPILRVENARGEVVWEPQPERTPALDPLVARIMVDLLQEAANNGTAGGHRDPARGNLPWEVPTAGKTGTTNDGTDTWFTGFTPNLLASVWFGMDLPQPILETELGATGGGLASPVWGRFMREVYYGPDGEDGAEGVLPIPRPWPIPPELTTREVDVSTGLLWLDRCGPPENRYREYYIPGTEPTRFCDDASSDPLRWFRRPPPPP